MISLSSFGSAVANIDPTSAVGPGLETWDLEQAVAALSIRSVLLATLALLVLIGITAVLRRRAPRVEVALFWSIVSVVVVTTVTLIASTVYLNTASSSGGPVHWHADFELYACGQELELKDPSGFLSNKIGTSTLHEHNDKRVHLEGVVVHPRDASLGKFFQVIGGQISANSLVVPTNTGTERYLGGQRCGGRRAEVQAFVYRSAPDKSYTLEKLDRPDEYIISPHSNVPPGDCVIIEFDTPKTTTDKMCRSYQVALDIGRLQGVPGGN
ncbi:hypothetical protein KY386_03700 [Candidatus Parcubacteria bacterium]|nr:hypothetical protein [Candidatus Parcubacteria bacterium]